jgi:tRNA threonylcarbamoyladenosine biosynthesis protein TsaB
MLILGVDTSGKNGSIALVQIEHANSRTLEIVPLEGGTFSAQLVPQISDMLTRNRLTKRDIDAFAVASGPGSFTGLRVGLAAIKALAEVLQKPIAAVSLLEAVVRAAGAEGELIAAIDASRGEVYVADIQVSGSRTTVRDQQLLAVADFVSMNSNREIVTPDEKIADVARENRLQVKCVERPRADAIARLGFDRIQTGEAISPESLDANYIRRSDAEVKKFTTPKE